MKDDLFLFWTWLLTMVALMLLLTLQFRTHRRLNAIGANVGRLMVMELEREHQGEDITDYGGE